MRTILSLAGLLCLAWTVHGQYNQQQQRYNQNQQQQGYQQNQQNQYQQNQQNQQYRQNGYQQQQAQTNQRPGTNYGQHQQANQLQSGQQYQQQQYGQQNMANQNGIKQTSQAQGTRAGAVSNNPIRADASDHFGAQIDLQLTSYSNPSYSLSNMTTCVGQAGPCPFLKQDDTNHCQFSFTIVISSDDQTVKLIQTDFFPYDGNFNSRNWTQPISLRMPSKPVAVDVFVQHLGAVIAKGTTSNVPTSTLLYCSQLIMVDSFAYPLRSIDPSQNIGTGQATLQSQTQPDNKLGMKITVQCLAPYMGPQCNLQCDSTNTNGDFVLCTDTDTSERQSCRFNSLKTQVTSCVRCFNVNEANKTCADSGTQLAAGMVSNAFRTWTIVLGCLLGIALLIILCLIISYIICRNRAIEEADNEPPVYKPNPYPPPPVTTTTTTTRHDEWTTSPARRPLLEQDSSRQSDDMYRPSGMAATPRQEHQV